MDKIVIIDGNSLFYRSFYALPLLTNEVGEYSNAVYGFAVQIVKIISEVKPSHIAVAFDAGKHTFRNDLYDGYKATRKPMPPELKCQVEPLKKMLKSMNIKCCEKVGLEGDDVLGTLAKRFSDIDTIIYTADRDSLQLIDDTTRVFLTKKGTTEVKIMDKDSLKAEYGVEPSQIVDIKALQGDMSDNIPGVKGIGEKIAQNLVKKYGSLDQIYAHIDEITGKTKDYLLADKDNAYLSYKLAKINTEVDVECELKDCKYIYPFSKDVYDFFVKYEFKSLLKRPEIFADASSVKTVKTYPIEQVDSLEKLQELNKNIDLSQKFAFYMDNVGYYYSFGKKEYAIVKDCNFYKENSQAILQSIKQSLKKDCLKIVFDAKQLMHFMYGLGETLNSNLFDMSIAKHLISGQGVKSADDILVDDEERRTPASIFYNLQPELLDEINRLNMQNLYYNVELPLTKVLFNMEVTGFKIDVDVLDKLSDQYSAELHSLEEQIYEQAGIKFNINSPKQLGEILYDKLGLKHGKKKSTSAEILETLKDLHPIVPLILRYRKVAKLNSTYIEGFRPHLDKDNLVHTSFKQTLTNTGRLSSVDPNLQNIPVRSEDGRVVRSMFIAKNKDHVLVDADYSQIELRLMAHMSGDEYFIDAFKNNKDIHTQTASQVFNVEPNLVTKDMRRIAKVVNFGIIYGISEYGLSSDLGIKAKEAKKLIEEFYLSHPKVKEFMKSSVETARQTGRVSTLLGRSRKMTEITSTNYMVRSMAERASQNMPLQGSASDIVKLAMIKVDNSLKENGLQAKLILQVHDELIIDCPISEEEKVKQIVKTQMENAYKLSVPLTVDVTSSYRWSDGH